MRALAVLVGLLLCLSLSAQRLSEPYKRPSFEDINSFVKAKARPLWQRDTVKMVLIGDVMMHSKQLDTDWSLFLRELTPIFREADITVANMEFPLGGKPYTGYPVFSTPDEYPPVIRDAGIDIFLLANNHVLDKGARGLERTLEKYRGMKGIQFTGASSTPQEDTTLYPLIVVAKGIRIALVNFTYGTNQGGSEPWPKVNRMNKEDVLSAIGRARRRGADYIIALPHWGIEYNLTHSPSQESWARWLVENGCDAVIGAHPHVVQDATTIDGVPVFYSLGNAVSNMSAQNTRLELLVTLRWAISPDGTTEMLSPETTWLWCTLPGKLTHSYSTIPVEKYLGRRELWMSPDDYDNMVQTLERVGRATGISKP